MKNFIFLDERYCHRDKAMIPVDSPGFMYGEGFFETMRAYNGIIFRLRDHMERLINSCLFFGFQLGKWNIDMLEESLRKTILKNEIKNAYVKMIIYRTSENLKSDRMDSGVSVSIITRPLPGYYRSLYKNGMKASILPQRRNEKSIFCRHKSLNYFENVYLRDMVRKNGFNEGIFFNTSGYLCEGIMSNIFIVKNGVIKTPPIEDGILPGITRKVVIEICREINIEIKECHITREELLKCNETFMTNSLMEIMPLTLIDSKNVGTGLPGPITQRLLKEYKSLISGSRRLQPAFRNPLPPGELAIIRGVK